MSDTQLHLHQELLLLALNNERGTTESGAWLPQAMGAGALADLLIGGRVRVEAGNTKAHVEVVDGTPFGDSFLDDCLARIQGDAKSRTAQDWVTRIANTKELKVLATNELVERGILHTDKKKVLWIFERNVFPERDPEPEREIRARVRAALLEPERPASASTLVLISLAERTGLLRTLLDKRERKDTKPRIKAILAGEVEPGDDPTGAGTAASAAAKAVIEQLQAAIFVTTIIAT